MSEGWIKLHRSVLDNWLWEDSVALQVWIFLLLKATHKPVQRRFGKKAVTLKPGQMITGTYEIAKGCRTNRMKVRRVLEAMQADLQIDLQTSTKGSMITIRNWDKYQNETSKPTYKRPTSDLQATTNKNERMKEVHIYSIGGQKLECDSLKLNSRQVDLAVKWFARNKVSHLLPFAFEEVDRWLEGSTLAARHARKNGVTQKTLYASWVLEKADKKYRCTKPVNGRHRPTTKQQRAFEILKDAIPEKIDDQTTSQRNAVIPLEPVVKF